MIGFIGQKATAAPDHFEKEHKQPTLPGVGLPNRIGQSTGASPFGRPCVHVGGSKPSMEKLIVELARFFLYRPPDGRSWPKIRPRQFPSPAIGCLRAKRSRAREGLQH